MNDKETKKGVYLGAGWMHAECCALLDRGEDPRKKEVSEMMQRMNKDLDIKVDGIDQRLTREEGEKDEYEIFLPPLHITSRQLVLLSTGELKRENGKD